MSLTTPQKTRRVGLKAWLLPLVVVTAALAVPVNASHSPVERTCSGDYPLIILDEPSCSTATITCPASHGGFCSFRSTVTVTGSGIVSGAAHGAAAVCGPSTNSCTAEHVYNVSPGLTSSTLCEVGLITIATNVHLACRLRG